jgi:hypothetical protein
MKSYIVYNSVGVILRSGSCIDTDYDIQADEGESIIEGYCNDTDNHKVIDGQVVYSKKVPTAEEVQEDIRRERNTRLSRCDWTQVPDAPVNQEAWRTYRQALRDLPSQYQNETDFANVVFPNPPE